MAQRECNKYPGCDGVTFSKVELGGAKSIGPIDYKQEKWGFQLRVSTTLVKSIVGEVSWVRTGVADPSAKPLNACYGDKKEESVLSGCVNGCLDYPNLEVALKECTRIGQECGGVSLAHKSSGPKSYGAFDTNYGY